MGVNNCNGGEDDSSNVSSSASSSSLSSYVPSLRFFRPIERIRAREALFARPYLTARRPSPRRARDLAISRWWCRVSLPVEDKRRRRTFAIVDRAVVRVSAAVTRGVACPADRSVHERKR